MRHHFFKPLIALAVALSCLLPSGCSDNIAQPAANATPASLSTPFTGQKLGADTVHLSGTPFYAKEISTKVKPNEVCYMLLSSQDPQKALLVVEAGMKAEKLTSRQSSPVELQGKIEWLELPDVLSFSKDKMGVELSVDESGRVAVLYAQPKNAGNNPLEKQSEGSYESK